MIDDPYQYFRIEARELVEGLTRDALSLEAAQTAQPLLGSLMRRAHTLKGAASVVRCAEIARQAHAVESVLEPYRGATGAVPRSCVEEVLHILASVEAGLQSLGASPAVSVRRPVSTPGVAVDALSPEPAPNDEMLRVELAHMDALFEGTERLGVQLAALGGMSKDFDKARKIVDVLASLPDTAPSASGFVGYGASSQRRSHALIAEELRVILDGLARTHTILSVQATEELEQLRVDLGQMRLGDADVAVTALESAAREAARKLGRKIKFVAIGASTRMDGHILAALRQALLHVVRNAVAHGIESPEDRIQAGKPPEGTVTVEFLHGDHGVKVICSDDGRGIDLEAIRLAARRRGVLPASVVDAMGFEQAAQLVLGGGLSTSSTVTETSGRGVGLDVVRDVVYRFRGSVELTSEAGLSTTVTIRVPISLFTVPALVVEADNHAVALPLDAIHRVLLLPASQIESMGERLSILHEEQRVPYASLGSIMRRESVPIRNRGNITVILIRAGRETAAIGTDRVLRMSQLIVRPLPALMAPVPLVAGLTFDAEGTPAFLLDASVLIDSVQRGPRQTVAPVPTTRPPVLVIDDSLTTRMLEQSILESAGYDVDLATSGEEAMEMARARAYALFIVDVEMPGMNGCEFVELTRRDPELKAIPAILVTSLGTPEDRTRGMQSGASAYIVKREFDESAFIKTIRELIG